METGQGKSFDLGFLCSFAGCDCDERVAFQQQRDHLSVWGKPRLNKLKTCKEEESKQIFEISENIYKSILTSTTVATTALAAYYLSKRGVQLLTEKLASNFNKTRVISISPGVILTPMVEKSMEKHSDQINYMIDKTPVKRIGTPEDIAAAVKFLTVDSTYVTGQVLEVDGGLVI